MHSLSLKIGRWLSRHYLQNKMPLKGSQGVVSITFDDVAASTCDIAGTLLDQYQSKGTFYVAGGLTDKYEEGLLCHSQQQLIDLAKRGHELGGHSYSHVHYDQLSSKQIQQEIQQDIQFLASCGADPKNLNFAYPFGGYSFEAKLLCHQYFTSSRITGGGTMIGETDLQLLPSYRLYEKSNTDNLQAQIQLAAQHHGWLILNTHDISDQPSPYGCSTDRLENTMKTIQDSGCQILSVRDAITYWKSFV